MAATRDGFVFGLIPPQARRRLRPPHDQFLDEPNRSVGTKSVAARSASPDRSLPRMIGRNAGGACNAGGAGDATTPARGEREDAMLDRPTLPIDEIVQIAANSALARVSWRRPRPGAAGLHQGHGRDVRGGVCASSRRATRRHWRWPSLRPATGIATRSPTTPPRFAALGMRNDVSGVDTLRHLFVLMIGLGHARIVGPLLRRPRPARQQH